jgi:hypothetical protein
MIKRILMLLLLLAATASAPTTARADPTSPLVATPVSPDEAPASKAAPQPHFGQRGTLVLGLDFDTGAANTGIPSRPLGLGVRPTLDAFVLEGLSLGAAAGFEYSRFAGQALYNYGAEVRVGYALRINDRFAIWPKILTSYTMGGVPIGASSTLGTLEDARVGANLPLVFTLGGHTMFEVGPIASTDIWRSVAGQSVPREDIFGLRAGFVGWF